METAEKNHHHHREDHKPLKETMAVEDLEVYSLEAEKPKEVGQASSHPLVEP